MNQWVWQSYLANLSKSSVLPICNQSYTYSISGLAGVQFPWFIVVQFMDSRKKLGVSVRTQMEEGGNQPRDAWLEQPTVKGGRRLHERVSVCSTQRPRHSIDRADGGGSPRMASSEWESPQTSSRDGNGFRRLFPLAGWRARGLVLPHRR